MKTTSLIEINLIQEILLIQETNLIQEILLIQETNLFQEQLQDLLAEHLKTILLQEEGLSEKTLIQFLQFLQPKKKKQDLIQ